MSRADRAEPSPAAAGARRALLAEPATALTDLGLGLLAGVLAGKTARGARDRCQADPLALRGWFVLLFGATAVAAVAGAIVHGPVADPRDSTHRATWMVALASVSVSGVALSAIAARLLLPRSAARLVTAVAATRGGMFVAGLRSDTPYASAVAQYAPGVGFVGLAFLAELGRPEHRRPALTGLAALGLTLLGAGIQRMRIVVHPRHFDHNAVYHCIQAGGILLLDRAATGLMRAPR